MDDLNSISWTPVGDVCLEYRDLFVNTCTYITMMRGLWPALFTVF